MSTTVEGCRTSFKAVFVARFRDNLPRDEARRLWTEVHAPSAKHLIDMERCVQSHVIGAIGAQGMSDAEVAFDGYSCGWWKDRESFDAATKTDTWRKIVDEGPEVFDMSSMDGMTAALQERILRDGPSSPYKVVWFARFKEGISIEEASDHWLNVHGPIALRVPGIDRYVQNLVVRSIGPDGEGGEPTKFDGFSECWYVDETAYLRSQVSDAWDELYEDGFNFLDMNALEGMSAVLEEYVIK